MIIGFCTGVVSGVVVAALLDILKRAMLWYQNYNNSPYSGKWRDEIYEISQLSETGDFVAFDPGKTQPTKQDEYEIKHNKNTGVIEGTIHRVFPTTQKHRNWMLNGVIDNECIIFSFWSIDGRNKSNGCVYAKLVSDGIYKGYYLEEHAYGVIDKTPIIMKTNRTNN